MSSSFVSELRNLHAKGLLLGDLENSEEILKQHSTDASVFEVMPEIVFFPKSIADIQLLLKTYTEYLKAYGEDNQLTISVRAGGTCMSGGSLTTGLIINMTRHMNTVSIDPLAAQITLKAEVEMGAMFRDIDAPARAVGLMFASYTSSKDICGIGGMIGNNASGEKSVRHGATIDNVLGLEVILADGTLIRTGALENTGEPLASMLRQAELKKELLAIKEPIAVSLPQAIGRVSKCASGYRLERFTPTNTDLTPLFVGAQGTLGIVTRAVLKLTPLPTYTRLVVVSVDSLSELPYILNTVMKHRPEGVETFDINTFERARHIFKHEIDVVQPFFSTTASLVVLAQFSEETSQKTDDVALACAQELQKHPVRVVFVQDADIQDSIWKIRRSSYGVMRDFNTTGKHAVPCIEDIIVPVDQFHEFVPRLMAILKAHDLEYGYHGHIGDGALRIIPVFDFSQAPEVVAGQIVSLVREVFVLVKELRGNMSADHSDGIIRTPFLREFYGEEIFAAFVKTKLLFDPKGILNRGKKIGGTEDTIKRYLIKG